MTCVTFMRWFRHHWNSAPLRKGHENSRAAERGPCANQRHDFVARFTDSVSEEAQIRGIAGDPTAVMSVCVGRPGISRSARRDSQHHAKPAPPDTEAAFEHLAVLPGAGLSRYALPPPFVVIFHDSIQGG